MRIIRLFAIILGVSVAALTAGPAVAASKPSYIVVDAVGGAVLDAREAGRPWFPASLAKLMTVYLFLDAVSDGKLSLDDHLNVSKEAAAQPARKAYLATGTKIKAKTAMLAAVVHSSNDAAVVLAEAVSGSEEAFVVRMNATAKALGMTGSHFTNASGLPDAEARVTARDMALLAMRLMKRFPEHLGMFSKRVVFVGKRRLTTGNGLLDIVPGATGMKTGFTCWSGYNAVLTTERDGRKLITVVLGAPSRSVRNGRALGVTNATFKAGGEKIGKRISDFVAEAHAKQPDRVLEEKKCNEVLHAAGAGGWLAGWGVLVGAYPNRGQAWARLSKVLRMLNPSQRRGQRTLVPSLRRPIRMYNALLVGLSRKEVLSICGTLSKKKVYCHGLPPKWLNNPKAVWRN
jgi:D-alanyl-D-alanine carboxypeptidase